MSQNQLVEVHGESGREDGDILELDIPESAPSVTAPYLSKLLNLLSNDSTIVRSETFPLKEKQIEYNTRTTFQVYPSSSLSEASLIVHLIYKINKEAGGPADFGHLIVFDPSNNADERFDFESESESDPTLSIANQCVRQLFNKGLTSEITPPNNRFQNPLLQQLQTILDSAGRDSNPLHAVTPFSEGIEKLFAPYQLKIEELVKSITSLKRNNLEQTSLKDDLKTTRDALKNKKDNLIGQIASLREDLKKLRKISDDNLDKTSKTTLLQNAAAQREQEFSEKNGSLTDWLKQLGQEVPVLKQKIETLKGSIKDFKHYHFEEIVKGTLNPAIKAFKDQLHDFRVKLRNRAPSTTYTGAALRGLTNLFASWIAGKYTPYILAATIATTSFFGAAGFRVLADWVSRLFE